MKNIIYLHTHDMGRLIQPYGVGAATPHLQSMAENGILFRQCFACAPTCSPSRAALLTGMTPHAAGMLGLAHRGFRLQDASRHLAHYLRGHGYTTVLFGFQHEAHRNESALLGYESAWDLPGEPRDDKGAGLMERDRANTLGAVDFLRSKPTTPFFLSLGLRSAHRPFPEHRGHARPEYVSVPEKLPDTPAVREDMAGFVEMTHGVDSCVGEVLRAVAETGLEQETLIFFTTDHGAAFPHHKCTLSDTGIGVALIMQLPGRMASGKTVDALVSHLDVFPTICDVAELPLPDWLEGSSLVPLLTGEKSEIRSEIFSEINDHVVSQPERCVRNDRFKLVVRYGDRSSKMANIDNGRSKSWLLSHGLEEQRGESFALYDLMLDPGEHGNLASSPEHQQEFRSLREKLRRWMESTNDPLIADEPPPG